MSYLELGAADRIRKAAPTGVDPRLPVVQLMHEGIRLSFMLIYTSPQEALPAAVNEITSALVDRTVRPQPSLTGQCAHCGHHRQGPDMQLLCLLCDIRG